MTRFRFSSLLRDVLVLALAALLAVPLPAFAGGVRGRLVRGDNGLAQGGVYVGVNRVTNGSSAGYAHTRADGTWEVPLAPGDYKVYLGGETPFAYGYWSTRSMVPAFTMGETVTVTPDATRTLDATLPVAASVVGTLTSTLDGMGVRVYVSPYVWNAATSQWDSFGAVFSEYDGSYALRNLIPGFEYTFWFGSYPYSGFFYEHKDTMGTVDRISFAAGQTLTYSGALVPYDVNGELAGSVHDSLGQSVAGQVEIIGPRDGKGEYPQASGVTIAGGSYLQQNLEPGVYKVRVLPSDPALARVYAPGDAALSSEAATVVVRPAQRTQLDAVVPAAASFEGTVTGGPHRAPLSSAEVTALRVSGETGEWEEFGKAYTAPDGSYRFRQLPAGDYRISFEAEWFEGEYWDDSSAEGADALGLAAGPSRAGVSANLESVVEAEQVAGANRVGTAIAASRILYPDVSDYPDAVIITTGWNWPDALGASALAGAVNGPVLLTSPAPAAMPASLTAEVARLKANGTTEAYVLGDEKAVGNAVFDALVTTFGAGKVHRIGGVGRYATSLAIADAVVDSGNAGNVLLIAKGGDYPDALAAAPLSARGCWPILLAEQGPGGVGLSQRMKDYISGYGASKVVILGSDKAVSAEAEADIAAAVGGAGKVERWSGTDRISTAIAVAEHSTQYGFGGRGIGVVNGWGYADALAGGPLLGSFGYPMVLTYDAAPLRPALDAKLRALAGTTHEAVFVGGLPALHQPVRDAVAAALREGPLD